jgi:hypothetical protein
MAPHFVNAEAFASCEILKAWNKRVQHPVALANAAIVAAEKLSCTFSVGVSSTDVNGCLAIGFLSPLAETSKLTGLMTLEEK